MKKFRNFTPHAIVLNDGTTFQSEGVARVQASFTQPIDGICHQTFGQIEGLPESEEGVIFIVSALLLDAAKKVGRTDCVAPASGHPDVVRVTEGERKGQIVSVPCFIG